MPKETKIQINEKMERGDIYSIQNRFYVFLREDLEYEDISLLVELSDERRLISKLLVDTREKQGKVYFSPIDFIDVGELTDNQFLIMDSDELLSKVPSLGLYYEPHAELIKQF